MTISPTRFRLAYNRFQAIHEAECGWALDSFANRESFAFQWEGYKNSIPDRAMEELRPHRWKQSMVGTGEILALVIRGIEMPGNNLLQWEAKNGPDSRVHLPIIKGLNDPTTCQKLESLFFDLYKQNRANKKTFDALVVCCGKRFELLGYLFFIAAPDRFLPIRTRSFDKAFNELGLNLRTEGNCGWEVYLAFLATIRDVQRCLKGEGIADATLLDAHSFCWILARKNFEDATPRTIEPTKMVPFSGRLLTPEPNVDFTPNDEASIRDMHDEALKRQASGLIAEDAALDAEQKRLCKEGRADLANKVQSVANRPGMGFDIKSFESDGTDRFIEVKNVSKGNQFFLSEGEWLNSRERLNYWFYLVSGVDDCHCRVTCLRASDLNRQHLRPLQYLVKYAPE